MIVYNLHGFLQIRAGNCEGNIFPVVTAHGLDNDIHIDPVSGQEVEQPEGDSRSNNLLLDQSYKNKLN